jgi:hypothetical protein
MLMLPNLLMDKNTIFLPCLCWPTTNRTRLAHLSMSEWIAQKSTHLWTFSGDFCGGRNLFERVAESDAALTPDLLRGRLEKGCTKSQAEQQPRAKQLSLIIWLKSCLIAGSNPAALILQSLGTNLPSDFSFSFLT